MASITSGQDRDLPTASNAATPRHCRPAVVIHPELLMAACRGDLGRLIKLLGIGEGGLGQAAAMPNHQVSIDFHQEDNSSTDTADVILATPPQASTDHARTKDVHQPAVSILEGVTFEGDSVLHVVATSGDGDEFLKSAEVICHEAIHLLDACNKEGDTPLHCAARAGNSKMVAKLIEMARGENGGDERVKAALRKQNRRKETVLHEAVHSFKIDMVDMLLSEDSELARFPDVGISPLYLATLLEDEGIAQLLYSRSNGVLSYSGPDGQNVLHSAVLHSPGMTQMLLGWKKDLAKQGDQCGSTPLHFAVSRDFGCPVGELPTWQLLESNPSLAFQPDESGTFPIHMAASTGVLWNIIVLFGKCPDCVALRDAQGRTFLHVAVENKSYRIVSHACRRPRLASIMNIKDNDGNTALHLAVQVGHLGIFCSLLANRQVCLNLTNNNGQTPLDLAMSKTISARFSYAWNSRNLIYRALVSVGANYESCRWDKFTKRHLLQPKLDDEKKESEKIKDSTQTLVIGSVLITTLTVGATFAVPGGYRADDHINGGTPILAGRYIFDAFIMANTLAFICSSIATVGLMYSGKPMVDLRIRLRHYVTSEFFFSSSVTSLTVAFALGIYMLLAVVAHKTAIAICAICPAVVLYKNLDYFHKYAVLARPLHIRMGIRVCLVLGIKVILGRMLMELWPLIIIFGWASLKLKEDKR